MVRLGIALMERDLLPDWMVRQGIRHFCRARLKDLHSQEKSGWSLEGYAKQLQSGPVAQHTKEANQQHYEVPAGFFLTVLGKNRKYSCALFDDPHNSLDGAEVAALKTTVERAGIKDGMEILELGCGWGSLTLYMAKTFPNSKILAVSNSNSQRDFIMEQAKFFELNNVDVRTVDLSSEESLKLIQPAAYDRIVSIEMFEHFKNYNVLLQRCAQWLKPAGKLFVHIFTHARFAYPFETEGEDNWMGKYFFTGGQMPARNLLHHFQQNLTLEKQWEWNGQHYQKTAEAWLVNLDSHRNEVLELFEGVYGHEAKIWLARWRVFFISCAELFGFAKGEEWGVTHYLFSSKQA